MSKNEKDPAAEAPRTEKAKAAHQEDPKPEEARAEQADGPVKEDIPLPQVTFSTFVLSLASSALMQLGEVPNPESGITGVNLPLAKHTVDILSMLQDKIEHGMDAEEKRLMEGILYELRMKYVIKAK